MNYKKITKEIAASYPAIYHRLHARWKKNEYRPTPEAIAVMSHLEYSGPLTITEAARHFDRAQSAMSELIDRLQSQGMVDRISDARDRRRTLIWLTESGIKLLERSHQVLDMELLEICFQKMSQEECEQLKNGMNALIKTADSILEETRRKKNAK